MENDQEATAESSAKESTTSSATSATLDDQGRVHKKQKAVKRFRTAFILFSTIKHKEIREKLTLEKKHKGDKLPLKATEVAKLVSESWKTLPPDERAEWDKKAEEDRKRYQKEVDTCDDPSLASCSRKDPDAPKRPMSAFLSYSNRKRAALKRENPHLNNGEMSKILSKAWKEESQEMRQKYIDEARDLRKQHKTAVKERNKQVRRLEKEKVKRKRRENEAEARRAERARLNPGVEDDEDFSHQLSGKSRKASGKGEKAEMNKKSFSGAGAPKRPVSAFLDYSNCKRASLKRKNPSLSNADISRILSDQWKAEAPDVRQGFLDAAHDRRVKHKLEMDAWHKEIERKMRDQYQNFRTNTTTSTESGVEAEEKTNSIVVTNNDDPQTNSEAGDSSVQQEVNNSTATTSSAHYPSSHQSLATTTGASNNAGDPPIVSSQHDIAGIESIINLQYALQNSNAGAAAMFTPMQSGASIPATATLHQPINPFAGASARAPSEVAAGLSFSSGVPSIAYIPVFTAPGNPLLHQGNYPSQAAASLHTNPNTAAAVSFVPTVQFPTGAASFALPLTGGNTTAGLNTMAAGAAALNSHATDATSGILMPQTAAAASQVSLAQNQGAQLLSFQQNLAASGPSMGHGDGMVLPNGTTGNLQQQLMLMRDEYPPS